MHATKQYRSADIHSLIDFESVGANQCEVPFINHTQLSAAKENACNKENTISNFNFNEMNSFTTMIPLLTHRRSEINDIVTKVIVIPSDVERTWSLKYSVRLIIVSH